MLGEEYPPYMPSQSLTKINHCFQRELLLRINTMIIKKSNKGWISMNPITKIGLKLAMNIDCYIILQMFKWLYNVINIKHKKYLS